MLKAIRGAGKTITFETYIYWKGLTGEEFTRALIERAQAGVKVHVLFDAIGSQKIDDKIIKHMKSAGIQVEVYNPVRWYTLARMNNRTHRNFGGRCAIGFTGGAGIADEWAGDARTPEQWRDTHFRVEGPVVAQMQAAFRKRIEVPVACCTARYFPELARPATSSRSSHLVAAAAARACSSCT